MGVEDLAVDLHVLPLGEGGQGPDEEVDGCCSVNNEEPGGFWLRGKFEVGL